jgi:hypothetical protein
MPGLSVSACESVESGRFGLDVRVEKRFIYRAVTYNRNFFKCKWYIKFQHFFLYFYFNDFKALQIRVPLKEAIRIRAANCNSWRPIRTLKIKKIESKTLNKFTHVELEKTCDSDTQTLIPVIESTNISGPCPAELEADWFYGSDKNYQAAKLMGVELVVPDEVYYDFSPPFAEAA